MPLLSLLVGELQAHRITDEIAAKTAPGGTQTFVGGARI